MAKRFAPILGGCVLAGLVASGAVRAQEGSIIAWGNNESGQCDVPEPNADFVAVAGYWQHNLGLRVDGSIAAWGNNEYGQCNVPEPNAEFAAIAAGYMHSLGLKSNGTIVAWGWSQMCDVPEPNAGFVAIAAGARHSLGLKADGTIVAWGQCANSQCDVPEPNADFVAIACGDLWSFGMKTNGSILVWGDSSYGLCNVPEPNDSFVSVAAGLEHGLGLKADGSVVAWGHCSAGQCNIPEPNQNFVAIDAGAGHSLGLKSDGTIVAWGWDGYYQCDVPAPNEDFVAIAAGEMSSFGLRAGAGADLDPGGGGDYPSIQAALNAAVDGWIITLADGAYSGPGNRDLSFLSKRLTLRSATGNPSACIIDCSSSEADPHRGFVFESGETAAAILEGISIVNGWAAEGGAIRLSNASSPTIRNCRLTGNIAASGGALHITGGAAPRFEQTLIAGNEATLAGAVHIDSAAPRFVNCTIADNASPAAAIFANAAMLSMANTVIAFNGSGASILSFETPASLECCDIYGNVGGNYVGAFEGALDSSGNISVDPLFCSSELTDYTLARSSICLPTADLNPCGELIGAYGEGEGCDLVPTEELPQTALTLRPNYPNPFNPATQISFVLPETATVDLVIFDLGGRRVRSLVTGVDYAAGSHLVRWDSANDGGQPMPSGAYLCRLQAGSQLKTSKLLLLK